MQDLPLPELRPLDHLVLCGAPADPALTTSAGVLSYAALDEEVGRLAAGLLAQGARPGDRVASWLPKTVTACLLPLAAARAGLVHVPINPVLRRAQVAHILADAGARLLVTAAERSARLLPGDSPAECTIVFEPALPGMDVLPPSAADPASLAALLYTSGSTGRPKGVMLSHGNLWLGAEAVRRFLNLARHTRTLAVLPLAFDYGQNQLLATWAAGGQVFPLDYLLPGQIAAALRAHQADTLAAVPSLWAEIAGARWPDETRGMLRCLTNSGGHLPVPLVRRLRALFPGASLHLMYGLTEAFRASALAPELVDTHPDAVGTAIPFAELFVLDADGLEVGAGVAGELVQAGPLVAQGYWRDPEQSARRFRPAPASSRHGGKAVWSGDTVIRGEDGLLRVIGRDDDLIKVSGHRISPTEIEEAALASGLAEEAAAVAVSDDVRGARIHLFVRAEAGTEVALARALAAALPGFMQPAVISIRPRLPLGATGKVDRRALRVEAAA